MKVPFDSNTRCNTTQLRLLNAKLRSSGACSYRLTHFTMRGAYIVFTYFLIMTNCSLAELAARGAFRVSPDSLSLSLCRYTAARFWSTCIRAGPPVRFMPEAMASSPSMRVSCCQQADVNSTAWPHQHDALLHCAVLRLIIALYGPSFRLSVLSRLLTEQTARGGSIHEQSTHHHRSAGSNTLLLLQRFEPGGLHRAQPLPVLLTCKSIASNKVALPPSTPTHVYLAVSSAGS